MTAEIQHIALPSEDGLIDQALTALDAKLSALSATIADAQAKLLDMATCLPARQDKSDLQDVPSRQRKKASPSPPAEKPQRPVDQSIETKKEQNRAGKQHRPQQADAAVKTVIAEDKAKAAEAPSADKQAQSQQDDQKLLASLDSDTAERLQLIQRMSLTKVTIRELLEQNQGLLKRQASENDNKKKKHWWRL